MLAPQVFLEDEFHMACVCPAYSTARTDFLRQLGPSYSLESLLQLLHVMSGCSSAVSQAAGCFLVRIRQIRRRRKLEFERLHRKTEVQCFSAKRIAWRMRRKQACRHGVLFTVAPLGGCKCMTPSAPELDWAQAPPPPNLLFNFSSLYRY